MGEPLQMLLTWLLSFSGYGQANKARTRKEALVQGSTERQSWSAKWTGREREGKQEGRMAEWPEEAAAWPAACGHGT